MVVFARTAIGSEAFQTNVTVPSSVTRAGRRGAIEARGISQSTTKRAGLVPLALPVAELDGHAVPGLVEAFLADIDLEPVRPGLEPVRVTPRVVVDANLRGARVHVVWDAFRQEADRQVVRAVGHRNSIGLG
jgi:hypothetical protein